MPLSSSAPEETAIPKSALRDCDNVRKLASEDNAMSKKTGQYCSSSSPQSASFPEGLEKIGAYCFYNSGLEGLVIPSRVSTIGRNAFEKCFCLKKVAFQAESRLQKIETSCFEGSTLEEISIPRGVVEIQKEAFRDCKSLRYVRFGKDSALRTLGASAFHGCSRLKNIFLPRGLEEIGELCF